MKRYSKKFEEILSEHGIEWIIEKHDEYYGNVGQTYTDINMQEVPYSVARHTISAIGLEAIYKTENHISEHLDYLQTDVCHGGLDFNTCLDLAIREVFKDE